MSRFCRAGPVLASLLVLTMMSAQPACAEDYPDRKITFLVGFAPGGGIDTFARVIAQALSEKFG